MCTNFYLISLGRRTQRTLGSYVQNYEYLAGAGAGSTTTLISKLESNVGHNYSYTYDNLGNISTISEDGNIIAAYQYDSLSQLVREDDYLRGISTAYSYDAGGNITGKVISELENGQTGETIQTVNYAYDGTWKDKLVSYNGEAITYDEIGNPLEYRGGLSFGWENGRQLGTVTKGGASLAQYSYNDEGIRVSKTVKGVTTKYYLNGSTILSQDDGSNAIDFLYDDAGSPLGIVLGGEYYYYMQNAQGDIVGIIDSSCNVVAEYRYDAWGKIISITDGSGNDVSVNNNHIGNINPLRYRGYYYDAETGLYYLNSRYYDPETGRYINADGYVSTGQGILGNNMFAYCGNNPISRSDPNGNLWRGVAIGAAVGLSAIHKGNAFTDFLSSVFGAGATVVQQVKQETELSPPGVNLLVTVKAGTKESKTVYSKGNSTKPVSVYAKGRSDNWLLSSAGLKINISDFTLDISLGLDNIGISGSIRKENATNSFGLSADLSQLKVGFEGSTTVKWDENTDVTTYTNVSITGCGIAAIYLLSTTGQWYLSPQTVY